MRSTLKSTDPGREVDRRVKAMQAVILGLSYGEAMRRVFAEDPELKRSYAASGGAGPRSEPDARIEDGLEVDRRASAHMAEHGCARRRIVVMQFRLKIQKAARRWMTQKAAMLPIA